MRWLWRNEEETGSREKRVDDDVCRPPTSPAMIPRRFLRSHSVVLFFATPLGVCRGSAVCARARSTECVSAREPKAPDRTRDPTAWRQVCTSAPRHFGTSLIRSLTRSLTPCLVGGSFSFGVSRPGLLRPAPFASHASSHAHGTSFSDSSRLICTRLSRLASTLTFSHTLRLTRCFSLLLAASRILSHTSTHHHHHSFLPPLCVYPLSIAPAAMAHSSFWRMVSRSV